MEAKEENDPRVMVYIKNYAQEELLTSILKTGYAVLNIDYSILTKIAPDLSDMLLDNPDALISMFRETLKSIDIPNLEDKRKIFITVSNIPETMLRKISSLRKEDVGRLVFIEGIIKSSSIIRPVVRGIDIKCMSCGEIEYIKVDGSKPKLPRVCRFCGSREGFEKAGEDLMDVRHVVMTDTFDSGEVLSSIRVRLTDWLIIPDNMKRSEAGKKVRIIGIVKLKETKPNSPKYDIFVEALSILPSEQDFDEYKITPDDVEKIQELASREDIYDLLRESIAPSIYGNEELKDALVLQMFGATPVINPDGSRVRGNIHILIVGDPSVGKSVVLKQISSLMPRGRYVSGKSSSGVGLTATVRKDEDSVGGWVLDAGAFVLANGSLIAIDEFDKISEEDMVTLHEAMSVETISIAKASIIATLPASTSVLAGANPKFGRFDPMKSISEQINIPPTILSRFDLKFSLRDVPSSDVDRKVVDHMIKKYSNPEKIKPRIERDLLIKYIAYARRTITNIILSEEALEELKEFYLSMRSKSDQVRGRVAITLRQFEALIRLTQASAKVRLSTIATKEDALRAIKIMKTSLEQLGYSFEFAGYDIDRLEGDLPSSKRDKLERLLEVIRTYEKEYKELITTEELEKRAKAFGIDNVIKYLEELSKAGLVYSPRFGRWAYLGD